MSSHKQTTRRAATRKAPHKPKTGRLVTEPKAVREVTVVPPPAAPPGAAGAATALYDLVCDDEDRIGESLDFATCMQKAKEHKQQLGHTARCILARSEP